ncbi:tyrosine-type recombinase/integrase [Ruminococcus sp.]|mgnify:CR=1 FL=1|uniref:tyrosine-type recombinase/integrase n=1 Tax=Ruminococcus sp. TaxID=41978 RepID=UPI003522A904
MNVLSAYNEFIQEQKFRGNSNYTLDYYKRSLKMFLNFCGNDMDIEDIDVVLFKSYQLYISENLDINRVSVRTYARAVKVFLRWLYFEDYIDIDVNKLLLMKATKDVIIPLSDTEVKELIRYYDNSTYLNCRNKTMLMLMLDCGLRLSEVVNLKISDLDLKNNYLIINGKGSKQRLVPFGILTKKQLVIYMQYRVNLNNNNSLFLNQNLTAITTNTIKMLFARLKKQEKFKRIYPHLLRHTFATNFIYAGGNLEVLRVLMGHSTINITQIYIHLAAQKHLLNDSYQSDLDRLL